MADMIARRVLLVDDEANFRWGVKQILEIRGYEVVGAESAEAALKLLGQQEFDLVITDIRMPGMDGFELVKWLRTNLPQVRVMMTTGFDSQQVRDQSFEAGAICYLEKPLDQKELTDLLQRLFSDGFVGRVQDVNLFDYLQLLSNTRKDKILEVHSNQNTGWLHLRDGLIVHASTDEQAGPEAFYSIMEWTTGDFKDHAPDPSQGRTIFTDTAYLLMEAARRIDERRSERDRHSPDQAPPEPPAPRVEVDRYLQMLDGAEGSSDLAGAMLLDEGGKVLAQVGDLPAGLDFLMQPLCAGCKRLGDDLGLGPYNEAVLHLQEGEKVLMEPLGPRRGPVMLGALINPDADMADVRAWIRKVALRAQGR